MPPMMEVVPERYESQVLWEVQQVGWKQLWKRNYTIFE